MSLSIFVVICILQSFLLDSYDALIIIQYYTYKQGYVITMSDSLYEETILLLFAIALMCTTLLIIKLTLYLANSMEKIHTRCLMNWHVLRNLKVSKFQKTDEPDVCIICLEDYVVTDTIKTLRCNHSRF